MPLLKIARRLAPERMFQLIWDNFQALSDIPLLGGVEVTESVSSGANSIAHGLGRIPRGWLVVRQIDCHTVYEDAEDSTDEYLVLQATTTSSDAELTVRVW